jgi:hypothetical protein
VSEYSFGVAIHAPLDEVVARVGEGRPRLERVGDALGDA